MSSEAMSPFNSALETGLRALAILVASYPSSHDLTRLTQYDYLVVHSADAGGPPSLHPPTPLRSGELLVRRNLVQSGLMLMESRSLIQRIMTPDGFLYRAEDAAGAFLDGIRADYLTELRDRSAWVSRTFNALDTERLREVVSQQFEAWMTEFQPINQAAEQEGR